MLTFACAGYLPFIDLHARVDGRVDSRKQAEKKGVWSAGGGRGMDREGDGQTFR